MNAKLSPSFMLHYFMAVTSQAASLALVIILLVVALSLALPFAKLKKEQQPYLKALQTVEQKISKPVRSVLPVRIGGHDMTGVMILIGSLGLSLWLNGFSYRSRHRAEYIKYKSSIEEMRARKNVSEFDMQLSPLSTKLDQLKTATKKDREQIIREFAETKRKLDEMGRDLAFLAIDIVDSTGMKIDEDKAVVQHDFIQYRNFVSRILEENNCLKSSWTPDGVMTCFSTVDGAVKTATAVIDGLEAFNREVKQMKRDFAVRCGVNSGFVIYDESMPLEMISDRAIDIAGHMQKYAETNTVNIAKPAIEPLHERTGFSPSGKVVDGYEVYAWKRGLG